MDNGFKRYRLARGMSQADVAAALGVHVTTVSKAERGDCGFAFVRRAWEWSRGDLGLADFLPPGADPEPWEALGDATPGEAA